MARTQHLASLSLVGLAALGCGDSGHATTSGGHAGAGGHASTSSTGGNGGNGGASSSSSSAASSSSGGGAGSGGTGGAIDVSNLDQDGDGWTPAQGDCCDVPSAGCPSPALVNPGAFEYPGNGVDDDCDPATLDNAPPPSCSPAAVFGGVTAEDLLRALDLCVFADDAPASPKDRRWGVINGSAALLLADGVTPLPASDEVQAGVLTAYGPSVTPQKYATMAALSSGTARALGDPGYVHPQNGAGAGQVGNFDGKTQVTIQSGYLAPHGGEPPAPAACSAACASGCDQAFDSVDLRARIRVPTNARSFSYQFKFYSAEFPEYRCQKYNDFFVALLASSWVPDANADPQQMPLPADGNIALDAQGNPVSVNNGFFQVCFPAFGAPPGTCPSGTLDLVGNGMGGWGANLEDGGGTEWLTNTAPAVPGETIELQFVLWDAGDHNVDSLVLLDHFRWSVTPSPVGVSK